MKKNIIVYMFASVLLFTTMETFAASSENYQINQSVINSAGNSYSGSAMLAYDSVGEALSGQTYGEIYSFQAGFFNDYFMPAPSPTVTPTVIRTFGGEILDERFVFAAPNPIRGIKGNIYFDLAERAEVWLKIYTPHNQLVISQHWDSLSPGTNRWIWNAANIANGVYIVYIKATGNNGKTTVIKKKIALIK
jgi:hypothetical protein